METQLHFTTQGLVIKEMNVGENDRLITLFTKEYGILKAYVAGAKSIKSKRSAACSLLTYSSFTVTRKGENYRITEAETISSFFSMGMDVEILSLCQYFCELSSVFVGSMIPNEEFLRLILNSMHFLTKEKKFPPLIKAITEFRIAVISGYSPNLVACDSCGKFEDDIFFFNMENGSLICKDCTENIEGKTVLDRTTLSALRHIAFSEFKKLYSFEIPEKSAISLSKITQKYLNLQTDYKFKTLDFLNSITTY
ncbi:MAG: DNA repair protein RecO [Clostridia bacterium]|nr:DNA repair protein RecO [Clostridia bacterium]